LNPYKMSAGTETLKNDREFLLRCALTQNWDVLIGFCSLLIETFTCSVPDRYQEDHKSVVFAATRQLAASDQYHNTALHAACYNKPPLRVVTSILNAASMVPGQATQLHFAKARDGSTPLQVACACGASKKVIRALLNPPGGLVSGGRLVAAADQQGDTPLSELVMHYSLERKCHQHRTSLPLDEVNLVDDDPSPLFDTFWAKVEMLVRAAWCVDQSDMLPSGAGTFPLSDLRDTSFISVVHGSANLAESCPPILSALICRCYPHMISYTDRKGILPLHLAVTTDKVRSQSMVCPVLVERRNYFIQKLVEMYPFAVRRRLPGSHRSTFCQAIVSGLHWHDPSGKDGALQILWNVAPELAIEKDSVTQQYPFLLAASSALTLGKSEQEGTSEDVWQLDTIYSLMRLYPQLLQEIVERNVFVAEDWLDF
jgi:ankyrin repeat protein